MAQSYDTMSAFQFPLDMDYIEKNAGRFGWGSLDFSDLIKKFDISRFPDYDNMAEPYVGYIFMSRPDLNLTNSNWNVLKNHPMTALFMNDQYGQMVMRSLASTNTSAWLPIITNRAMSYQVTDFSLKSVEKGNTYYGHALKYGKHSEEHKYGGSITIEFRNDRQLSIMKMMYLWMCYIYIISKTGEIAPSLLYEETGILDYAASIYFVVVRRNMREIVYIEKLVGVYPKSLPFSIFNYNDGFILNDTIQIEFDYGIKADPMDPSIFVDINYLSGMNIAEVEKYSAETLPRTDQYNDKFHQRYRNQIVVPDHYDSPFTLSNTLARVPFVHMVKDTSDSSLHYYLEFLT